MVVSVSVCVCVCVCVCVSANAYGRTCAHLRDRWRAEDVVVSDGGGSDELIVTRWGWDEKGWRGGGGGVDDVG
jgi:hypothetical protein